MAFKKRDQQKGKHAAPKAFNDETFSPQAFKPAFDPETGQSASVQQSSKKGSAGKATAIAVGVVAVLLAGTYVGGSLYFQDRFFPNTKLGTIDVSMKTAQELGGILSAQAEDYKLQVTGDEFDQAFTAEELGFSFQKDSEVAQLLEGRNPWLWPAELFASHDVTSKLVATCDEATAGKTITKAVKKHNKSAENTRDATIRYSDSKKAFVVVPEKYGTKLQVDATVAAIEEAAALMQDKLELDQEHLVQPKVVEDDSKLKKAVKRANKMIEANVTLKLANDTVTVVDAELISDWVILGDNARVSFDTAKMTEWVTGVAKECDTVGTQRTYKRPDGEKITVKGGDYGWAVDHEALIKMVKDDVLGGKTVTETIPTTSEGATYKGVGQRDWGKRYVDVDLGEQRAYFYDEKGKLIWESDCVSGLATPERETPTGVYSLNLKQSPSTLIGYKNGKKDYETKVSYWMPFIGNSIGLHDATWRSSFGGKIYQSNGSHGCINLPAKKAKKIYSLIKVGDVVVVHY